MDDNELLSKFKIYRQKILTTLYKQGEMEASELRKEVGYPAGSKGHYPNHLEELGLIEEVGRVGALDEREFDLTERGKEFTVDHLLSRSEAELEGEGGGLKEQVKRLNKTVARLERELNQRTSEDQDDRLERIEGKMVPRDELMELLDEEYWRDIIDEIEART